MRYSLDLIFQLKSPFQVDNLKGKQHLNEELDNLEAFCDSFGGGLGFLCFQGGNMIQNPSNPNRIYLQIPVLNQSLHFTTLEGRIFILRNLKVYNMACSLSDCVLEHDLVSKDRRLYFQITIKTSNEYYYKLLKDLYDSLYF